MDYLKRIEHLREKMKEHELDYFLTTVDANMEYLTGIPRIKYGKTKQRQNGTEYACMLISEHEIAVFLPILNYIVTMAKLGDKKPIAEIFAYADGDHKAQALSFYLNARNVKNKRFGVTEDITALLALKLQREFEAQIEDADDIILDMKSVKDKDELIIIREAAEIADKAFTELVSRLKIGASTEAMEREFENILYSYGASMLSFDCELNTQGPKAGPMVGFSHHTLEEGYVLGVDFGIVYKGYCTDYGRTIFIGEPSEEHKQIYKIVIEAENAAINAIMGENPTGDILNQVARDVIEKAGYGERFIHKLGHSIGLDVHERPLLAKGDFRAIKSGMIFAIEPSIFIPHNCFIRIEDMVLVTDSGYEILSKLSRDYFVVK